MLLAITRGVSPSMSRCELTHLERRPIDPAIAAGQHAQYEECLRALGCTVQRLPAVPDLPDCVFVEDVAVVLDELAVITRPGAESRRGEVPAVAQALAPYRKLACIEAPGTVDGGDVLRVGRTLYVGLSGRSNAAGIEQMRAHLAPYGYTVTGVPVSGCLHLKSAVTQVGRDTLLINRHWVEPRTFAPLDLIDIDPSEPQAANGLLINGAVIYPQAFPRTKERLEQRGIAVRTVDLSELAKAEGAVTCCSLIVRV